MAEVGAKIGRPGVCVPRLLGRIADWATRGSTRACVRVTCGVKKVVLAAMFVLIAEEGGVFARVDDPSGLRLSSDWGVGAAEWRYVLADGVDRICSAKVKGGERRGSAVRDDERNRPSNVGTIKMARQIGKFRAEMTGAGTGTAMQHPITTTLPFHTVTNPPL